MHLSSLIIAVFFASISISSAPAQIMLFTKPGDVKTLLRIQTRSYGDLHSAQFNATIPIAHDGNANGGEVWNLTLQAADTQIQQPGTLPNNGSLIGTPSVIPDHFWNVGAGIQYTRSFDAKRFWSASFAVASPSDAPFSSGRVNDYVGNVFYGFPNDETSNWTLMLNYSNNRPILNGIPLPGFAYSYTPSRQYSLTVGFPFAILYYEFVPQWSVTAMALGVSVLKAELGYRVIGPVTLYTGLDFNQEVFLREDRSRTTDRFFYAEKKVLIGVRSPLSQVFFADLSFGMSFDRSFFEVEKFSDRDQNERKLAKSGVFGFSLGGRF